jgi:hypothetical protein
LSWGFELMDFEFTFLLDPLVEVLSEPDYDLRGDFTNAGVTRAECSNTCLDGMQNNGETGVDCGGPCLTECPVCESGTNLLTNGSFEVVAGGAWSVGDMPDDWLVAGNPPDVYSDDGSWALHPGEGSFRGLYAFDGNRFVAASAGGGEMLAQQLAAPLTPGVEYRVRARLLEAMASFDEGPGGYRVYLSPGATLAGATQVGTLEDTTNAADMHPWEGRAFAFTAPGNAGSLGYLVLEPTANLPAIDDVVLSSTVACP